MPRPFIPITIQQFAELLTRFKFTRPIREVHVHGTWRPNHSQDNGLSTIESMFLFHTKTNGWSDIAQHLTIDSKGLIWTGRSWNQIPASATGHNTGAFMFEMVGDFDNGKDEFTDAQRLTAHLVTAYVLRKCDLALENVRFHREFTTLKTCPGTSLDLKTFRQGVKKQLLSFADDDSFAFDEESESNFMTSDNGAGIESAKKVRNLLLDFLDTQSVTPSEAEQDVELDCGPQPTSDVTETDPALEILPEMFRTGANPETTDIVMDRNLFGATNVKVQFTEVDGMALYEGDIVLAEDADQARKADKPSSRGIGRTGTKYRWAKGIVPYVIKDASLKPTVDAAIAHWQQQTPFKFVPKNETHTDYVSFEKRSGCWSQVGRQGGMQVISLGNGCGIGSAIHEIGHTLGLWHEQSRADRDQHIKVVIENIDPQAVHNFDKHILDGQDLGAYDFGSIMHYPATAFSINGKPTIVTAAGQPIGQRNGLSNGDIAAIKLLYPKLKWT